MSNLIGFKKYLRDNQIPFTEIKGGGFVLYGELDNGRSQHAIINFDDNTEDSFLAPAFTIKSSAMQGAGQLSADIANQLLNENVFVNSAFCGSWTIDESDDGTIVVSLVARLPESVSYISVFSVVNAIMQIADNAEKRYMSSDEY